MTNRVIAFLLCHTFNTTGIHFLESNMDAIPRLLVYVLSAMITEETDLLRFF